LLETAGVGSFPKTMLILLVAGLIIAWRAKKHDFRPGARHETTAQNPNEQEQDQSLETARKV
jgi:hypothetical protein